MPTIDPDPLERYDLSHPAVPPALDGLTILHITDGHVRSPQGRDPAFGRLLAAIRRVEPDLVALTGDYMTEPGDEPHALDALERMRDAWKVRYGAFGVFGNHDSHAFKVAARAMGGVTWVENRVHRFDGLPLRLIGGSYPEDVFGAVLADQALHGEQDSEAGADAPSLPFLISHYPTEIFPAADLGIPLMIAGHTHGGQIRLFKGHVPHTSSDFPSHVATGIIRLRHTVCAVSRGVGEAFVGLRVNCPRQLPLYTLRRGEAMRSAVARDEFRTITRVLAW